MRFPEAPVEEDVLKVIKEQGPIAAPEILVNLVHDFVGYQNMTAESYRIARTWEPPLRKMIWQLVESNKLEFTPGMELTVKIRS